MVRLMKTNNPFNIRFVEQNHWRGQIGKTSSGFCMFLNLYYGCRAFAVLYKTFIKRGYTVADFINRYAPPTENHTNIYISFVCSQLDCEPSYRLTESDFVDFAFAVASVESSVAVAHNIMPVLSQLYCKFF